jgi:pyruvate dehydrogenase E2 component (dihydrolipoamide acetyltransferase)
MMPVQVVLPKVDMDMESGIIAEWKVIEGAYVHQGDIVFEMETGKSMMEVEAPATGTIRGLAAITGEPVMVGTPVAWIDTVDSTAEATAVGVRDAAGPRSPARAPAAAEVVDARAIASARNADDGVRASPLARRAARTRGVDLRAIVGSGPLGRIVEKDVDAHLAARTSGRADASSAISKGASGDRLVPFSAVRRIVAQRLAESARAAPHFHLVAQVDMTALMAAQKRLAASAQGPSAKPSMTVLLAYIAGRTLMQHPMLNASVEGDAARVHSAAHIGVAMEHDGDLFVPVLRDAQSRNISELASDFARLRHAVRSRTILPSEMRGGTFTISNLGMYDVDSFTAIINPPESAILAIGHTVDTPVGRAGKIVLRPMATLSLSSDHRIVDGVSAARFMADLRGAIELAENPQ